jgi:hypothetical protein
MPGFPDIVKQGSRKQLGVIFPFRYQVFAHADGMAHLRRMHSLKKLELSWGETFLHRIKLYRFRPRHQGIPKLAGAVGGS